MHPSDVVLVTGATGFTGQALVPALRAAGATVVGVGNRAEAPLATNVDLLDRDSLETLVRDVHPTHVVHLAGVSAPTHKPVADIYAANVVGTVNLLEVLAEQPSRLQHVLLPSSATLYAPSFNGFPISEDDPISPGSQYAASKLAMEHAAKFFQDRMPIQIVRPFNYTGVGQRSTFFVPKIVQHFASRADTLRVGNLDIARDISDVHDVVEAMRRLIGGAPQADALNICSGAAVKLSRIVEEMADISGHSIQVIVDPDFVREREPACIVGSRDRLNAAVGAWPLRTLRETLQEMYAAATAATSRTQAAP